MLERKVAKVWHTNKTSTIATKHKSETDEPEENRTDHEIDEVLEQDVRSVFTAGNTRLTEGKSRLHEKDLQGC